MENDGGNGGDGWRKSTHSTTNGCVEVHMHWHKSSRSGPNGCVEVAFATSSHSASHNCVEVGVVRTSSHSQLYSCVEVEGLPERWVAVRDSKYAKRGEVSPIRKFSYEQWEEILEEIRDSTFNWRTFTPLEFNDTEHHAFVLGVQDNEFDLKESV
jgi:hypothetical protein